MEPLPRAATFIVRVSQSDGGPVTGTVERAQTGEKQRFDGLPAIGALSARMLGEPPIQRIGS